ncbi:unnamed protein product [Owenia fusiformis]|uniref:Uncharacterized protein n=1 Tax=Owenia fusiformis TaxID=6347 RepID=A0A8J1UPQ6_OWEFU|nr:unnamed protein product [Owenia fusiformis]
MPTIGSLLGINSSLKFAVGVWMFCRGLFIATIGCYDEAKKDAKTQRTVSGVGLDKKDTVPESVPTMVEIKRKIPAHCFESKLSTSLYYAIKDVAMAAIFYTAMCYYDNHYSGNIVLDAFTWSVYWLMQGTMFTAFFVVGHDAGHDSFSNNWLINDLIGTIFHTFLCTPFYGWKLSHRHHHKNTGNIDKDEVFYPIREDLPGAKGMVLPGFGLGMGYYGYLVGGYTPRNVPHFNPFHAFYSKHVKPMCITITAVLLWSCCLWKYAQIFGLKNLVCYYGIPLFIFATYCVLITFLHHTEVNVPWYGDSKWDYVRGQLSSVDRHYGWVHGLIHNIGTHQIHHLFTKIPHYHLEEATQHFRKNFPELVRICDEPILPSYWRMFKKYLDNGTVKKDSDLHVYH